MNKKIISIFTLFVFIIFSISCYTVTTKKVKTVADWQGKKGKIFWVIKTSGEYIEFSKDEPGRIYEDKIVGIAIVLSEEVVIKRANIKKIERDAEKNVMKIITKEDEIYYGVGIAKEEEDKIIFISTFASSESVSIALSEVKLVNVRRIAPEKIFLAVLASVGSVGLAYLSFLGFISLFVTTLKD